MGEDQITKLPLDGSHQVKETLGGPKPPGAEHRNLPWGEAQHAAKDQIQWNELVCFYWIISPC